MCTTKRKQKLRNELSILQNNRCAYCNSILDETATLDHIIPVSEGGETTKDNLVVCCRSCNYKKASRNLLSFIDSIQSDVARDKFKKVLKKQYFEVSSAYMKYNKINEKNSPKNLKINKGFAVFVVALWVAGTRISAPFKWLK